MGRPAGRLPAKIVAFSRRGGGRIMGFKRSIQVGEKITPYLTYLQEAGRKITSCNGKESRTRLIQCKCVCGMVKEYRLSNITHGGTLSCGCIGIDIKREKARLRRSDKTNFRMLLGRYKFLAKKRGFSFELTD